jgi:hypothetical protein
MASFKYIKASISALSFASQVLAHGVPKVEQIGGITNGLGPKEKSNACVIHVRWAFNLHSTNDNQVAPMLDFEWHGSCMQCESNYDMHPVNGVNKFFLDNGFSLIRHLYPRRI